MPQREYANPKELIGDPKFKALDAGVQREVMTHLFPKFNTLSPEAQDQVLLPSQSLPPEVRTSTTPPLHQSAKGKPVPAVV